MTSPSPRKQPSKQPSARSKKASGRSGTVPGLRAELAELRRRIAIVENLAPIAYSEDPIPGSSGDVIRRPLLQRSVVLAALHGDISEEIIAANAAQKQAAQDQVSA